MPIRYKVNVLEKLKEAGYSTFRLRKEKLMGEATIQKIRNGELLSWSNMEVICNLLNCQPGELVEYIKED